MKHALNLMLDAVAEWLAEKLKKRLQPQSAQPELSPDTVMERLVDYTRLTHKLFESENTIHYCVHPNGDFSVMVACRKCKRKNRMALDKSIYSAKCGSCKTPIVKQTIN